MTTRVCTKCHLSYPIAEFSKDRTKKSGRRPSCRICCRKVSKIHATAHPEVSRAWRASHKEHMRARGKQYYQDHKEERRLYRLAHRESFLLYLKEWQESHKLRMQELGISYRQTHAQALKEYFQEYRKLHPEYKQNKDARRRARKKNAQKNDLTRRQWIEIKTAYRFRCAYCGGKPKLLEQDHITPFVRGGSHTVQNVVPACHACNSTKGARLAPSMVQPLLLTIA